MSFTPSKHFRLMSLFAVILALLIFNGWFLYYNFQNVSAQEARTARTAQLVNELDLTLSAAKDAETGIRGYILTKDVDYLEPYINGRREAKIHTSAVRRLSQDNRDQITALDELEGVLQKRLDIIEALRTKVAKKAVITSDDIFFSEGKLVMDTLRAQIEAMKKTENQMLQARSAEAERSRNFFLWSLAATTLLSALVITYAFNLIVRNQSRMAEEAAIQAKNAQEKQLMADVASIVAGDASVEVIGQELLEFMTNRFGVLASKLLLFERGKLSTFASYGVRESKDSSNSLSESMAQSGLVSATLNRRQVWQVKEVPANYWQISSSLGSAVPNSLTMVPFTFQGRELGIIELATFEPLGAEQTAMIERLTETIAVGVSAAQSRAALQSLLEKTQQQSEELQAQQEELRTNNEELEQQARALESQQQSLNLKNRELEATQGDLQSKAQDLERSSQYKSEFLAKMSHELRTPLNGLMILSTLLIENKEKNLTDQQRNFAKSIHSAGNDLLSLINDILDLSKIEARKLTLRPETFTLSSLFESKKRTFGPQTSSKGLDLIADLPPELASLRMHTDRQRLEQILRNFISNAIKFTEKGSITLLAKMNEEKNTVTLTVSDTGIGIPRDKQDLIFEAFEQADGSVSRKYGGTGLGLTISRELASLLGGDITLDSAEGVGSRFSVEIPIEYKGSTEKTSSSEDRVTPSFLARGARQTESSTTSTNERVESMVRDTLKHLGGGKKTILIVEDDDKFRASVVEAIRRYNFEPIEAADGEIALGLLNHMTPDAILLDIKLPGISGLGILEMIKQMPGLRHIPVHMISALEYQRNALRMGALGYLTKPVTIEKINSALSRIESLLSKKLRRVLLIEDDERQNEAISHLISGADIEVVPAKTGKSAVAELKKEGFDCIILDLTLPDVSGFDLLAELSSLDISLPPVVIYTGKDLSETEEAYLRRYSESIVIKGARSPERLLDEVNLFLHRVESLLPEEKRQMLSVLRSQDRALEGKTVLLADDDIRNIFALTSALEAKGLQIRVARNGVEAITALEEHSDIDLVLMDIMMPKMDGFEAMRKIRSHSDARLRDIPIVALTAKAMKEDHEKCMDAGASDYIPKPINLDNLSTVLKVWLAPKGILG